MTNARTKAPDLTTFAKGVNSGYVPLGGVLISDRVAATFDNRPYPGGLTYSGHPLACASAAWASAAAAKGPLISAAGRASWLAMSAPRHAARCGSGAG